MKFACPPAYGFGRARKCEIERTDPLYTPGPGQYAPLIGGRRYPTWKIGTGPRGRLKTSDTPGPGTYIPDKNTDFVRPKTPSWKIGTGMRPDLNPVDKSVPGPGQYYPQYRSGSAKYTMRSKTHYVKNENTPGPGNYNVRTDKSLVVPSYKFGTQKKDGLDLAQSRYVPGPGNYEYNADAINVKNPKFSFGKELRGDNRRPNTPGPGQYSYKQFIGKEGPRITMSAKLGNTASDSKYYPGPGMYNNSQSYNFNHTKAPAYRIGTAKRRGLYNTDGNPGPGQYSSTNPNFYRPKTPSWKIGTGMRPDLNPVDKSVPGPGNYNVSKGLGNGPKYTIVGKGNIGSIKNGSPGPGQYNETMYDKTKNPAWKIGTGSRDDNLKRVIREGVPGPGMYDYIGKNKSMGPKYGFGTEKRGYVKKSDTPGPGQYHIPCAIVDVNDYTREQGKFNPDFRYI